MTEFPPARPEQFLREGDASEAKTPWIAPQVQVIAAGQAETSPRGNLSDGPFTTS